MALDRPELANKYPTMNLYTSPLKPAEREIIGREAEMRKLKAAMMRPELCNVILLAEAGTGKCLKNGTEIPVFGDVCYKNIEEIQVGDFVFDENGQPARVLGVYPQGLKHAYRVTFSDDTSIVCNDEHLWASRSRWQHNERLPFEVRTLRNMLDAGVIHHRGGKRPQVLKNWYVPAGHAVERAEASLPVHPYVVGVFLGDGLLTAEHSLELSSNDVSIVDRVAGLIGAVGYHQRTNGFSWYFNRKDAAFGCKYIQRDEVFFDPMFACMSGEHSIDRRIPRPYFMGSVEQRMELLRGLMDTDGSVVANDRLNCRFSTNSRGLLEDVRELAASLGIRTTMQSQERFDDIHINMEYSVHFILDDAEKTNLFWLARHRDKIERNRRDDRKFKKHFDDIAIASVEDLGCEYEMTCLYVDSPSHLFLAGRAHIVTHNTALVQGTMLEDRKRKYLEVDLSRMLADLGDPNEMATRLKTLFDEVSVYVKTQHQPIVLFIDEFHQIVQLSAAAVEALKPLLADSGTRDIRVIAATTYIEFQQFVAPNLPLVERLQRINISQPNKDTVISILKSYAKRYGVEHQFYNDRVYELIYEYTNRYIPASSQPRKSIRMMDSMIGYHRSEGRRLDARLLADVIYESEGVNVAFRVDATSIKKSLDKRVLSQQLATTVIEQRLQICVADLNDKSKPMSSFLFTGSTGVGKGLRNDEVVPIYTEDGSVAYKLNGDIKIGDYVFNRLGKPVRVVGVFPRGMQDIYKVTLSDGRVIHTDSSHLWTYLYEKGKYTANTYTNSTKELLDRGVYVEGKDGRRKLKYWIPMNHAVEYPEAKLSVHPYVMGAFIGDGCLSINQLTLSSEDEDLVAHVAELLGNCTYRRGSRRGYNWSFPLIDVDAEFGNYRKSGIVPKTKQTKAVFGDYPDVCGKLAPFKRIPEVYMHGSVEQRWQLVKGLFDTDGSIGAKDGGRYNVSFSSTSFDLIQDLQKLLYSLGVASTYQISREADTGNGHYVQYRLNVKSPNDDKSRFFWLPRKVAIAESAKINGSKGTKASRKDYEWVGISDIELLPEQAETTCIYVDDDEHLYQAGDFIVTHNTETVKALADILFEDQHSLIRMDMTEYANPDSLERFRRELTSRVWARPYSIILLDEIEKACSPVTRILLQVLDDGRLSDEHNREVQFTNAYIVLTTNAGSEIYRNISQYNVDDAGSGEQMKRYNKLIRSSISSTTGDNRFPPELLGRIDQIVPFQPLSENTMKAIVKMKLLKLKDEVMKKHNIKLLIHPDVIRYLVEDNLDTDSDSGGARIVMSKLETEVTTAVARYINLHPGALVLSVTVEGEMAADNKFKLISEAYIKVVAVK